VSAARGRRSIGRTLGGLLVVAALSGFALGCGDDDDGGGGGGGGGGDATGSEAKSAEGKRIAFFTDALDNLYLQAAVEEAKQVASEHGAKLDVFSADWDPGKQLTQVQDAVSSGNYDGMAVESIDGSALCRPVTTAAEQIPVAVFNTPICGDESYTEGTVGYFGRIDRDDGADVADLTIEALDGEGKIVYISGPVNVTIVQRFTEGFKEKLASAPGIELVAEAPGDWDPAKGRAATEDLLQAHDDLDAIVYGTDNMAAAGVKAIKAAGRLDGLKVITYGGTKEVLDLIRQDVVFGTVHLLPREEAGYAVQAVIDTLAERPIDIPGFEDNVWAMGNDPMFEKSGRTITKANVDDYEPQW
jgi:ABC-type sugar transport system substrate-binding protein